MVFLRPVVVRQVRVSTMVMELLAVGIGVNWWAEEQGLGLGSELTVAPLLQCGGGASRVHLGSAGPERAWFALCCCIRSTTTFRRWR